MFLSSTGAAACKRYHREFSQNRAPRARETVVHDSDTPRAAGTEALPELVAFLFPDHG